MNQLRCHPPVFSCYQGNSLPRAPGTWIHQYHQLGQRKSDSGCDNNMKPGKCRSALPCSACAAHAMNVLFYVTWEVVIKDMSYVVYIQPSRCQVCGDQDPNTTLKHIKGSILWSSLIVQILSAFFLKKQKHPSCDVLSLKSLRASSRSHCSRSPWRLCTARPCRHMSLDRSSTLRCNAKGDTSRKLSV